MTKITDQELARLIRSHVALLQGEGVKAVPEVVKAFRDVGITANMNMGKAAKESPRKTMEWYAGQFLDIVETESWFTMNSLLNVVDKFVIDLSDEKK